MRKRQRLERKTNTPILYYCAPIGCRTFQDKNPELIPGGIRHPGVNPPHEVVRLARDDRARVHPFIFCWIFPAFPQPSENEGWLVDQTG